MEYVLVGGAALAFHGIVRATEDLDLFIRPTADNVERLRQALRAVYADPCVEEISTEDLAGDYPSVRYHPPTGDLFLDIVARLGEFATIDDLEMQIIDVQGVNVRVATPRTLYWMKKDIVRPIDRQDAAVLREEFDLKDDEDGGK